MSLHPREIPDRLQLAGVAGAGGAGFPSYVKWRNLADIDHLLINHQESEPNFYADKCLGQQRASELTTLLEYLLETAFDLIVIGTKERYRPEWTGELETRTNATVYTPNDLPIDTGAESGIVLAYTPDVYTYSEESVLLKVVASVNIGDELPTDHGWIVQNTESLYNIYNALFEDEPVTRKFVHIDGETTTHRCLDVPIGTPASTLLAAADAEVDGSSESYILADGGPGWCYEIEKEADEFGVRKRTNGVLVLDKEVAKQNKGDDGEIDVLSAHQWTESDHETTPKTLSPDRVCIPRITNAAYEGFVERSDPVVDVGERVEHGDQIAEPVEGRISNAQHASIDGIVSRITETQIEITDS